MTPEKLLDALNGIDGKIIREAKNGESRCIRTGRRRFAVLLAAVIALMAMTITAFASEEIAGWFRHYFAQRTGESLTPGQIEYIEENEQIIAEVQANDGYAVELKSTISSGETAYITLGVTAPEDVALTEWDSISSEGFDVKDDQGYHPFSWGFHVQDDLDGLDNTANIVLTVEPGDWNNGSSWHIRIDALHTTFYDEAYKQELMQTKYAGQTDIMFTSEESARIHQYPLLAEGPWEFTISTENSDTEGIELLTEPILTQACVWYKEDMKDIAAGENVIKDVTVTSFILRPLDATIQYECDSEYDRSARFAAEDAGLYVYAVMKDGSRILLNMGNSTARGEGKLIAETPIVLDEVDYVLLADGTKLIVP